MPAPASQPAYYRMTLSEFLRRAFLGKPPSRNTIKAAIERKEIAGEKLGGMYFVFVDEAGQPIRPQKSEASPGTGNALADSLIMQWRANKG